MKFARLRLSDRRLIVFLEFIVSYKIRADRGIHSLHYSFGTESLQRKISENNK